MSLLQIWFLKSVCNSLTCIDLQEQTRLSLEFLYEKQDKILFYEL